MKKIYLLIISIMFVIPVSVKADYMYDIDMDIYIDKYGNANITEIWDVKATSGSEWYKQINNLGASSISNYEVYMDGKKLTYKEWNINENMSQKAGYYGINYTSEGLELCFGKSDKNRHKFTLNYNVSNFVFNTDDSQILYWMLLPNVEVDNFTIDITSYYQFPDTLEVWGYGYKGYAYIDNGKISMSNEGKLNNNYVVLLAKFPLNTFITNNTTNYQTFNDVYQKAQMGTYEYDYETSTEENSLYSKIKNFIKIAINFLIIAFIGVKTNKIIKDKGYGYANNKTIDKKAVPLFREIPCNKDIYYANILIKLNNFNYSSSNILGAILLKWIKTDKIGFKNIEKGVFNKNTSVIDLSNNPTFDNDIEKKLFNMMKEASKDEMLEAKELEKWCKRNYSKFLSLFTRIETETINQLKNNNFIYQRTDKNECKYKNIMNDTLYNDSVQLYGLKKYLQEFSKINTKEVMEVKIWDEYLMFAYLFGIADKVAKQLKDMYPEILENINQDPNMVWIDYNTLQFINHISVRSVYAASSAKSAAQSYSSGGGGFSSGGGGGGSFGGGGSMGGR